MARRRRGQRQKQHCLVARAHDAGLDEYTFCVLPLSEGMLAHCRNRMDLAGQMRDLDVHFNCLSWHDYSISFFNTLALESEEDMPWGYWEHYTEDELDVLADDYHHTDRGTDGPEARLDVCTVQVYPDRVHWKAHVKHCGSMLVSETLLKSQVMSWLNMFEFFGD